MSSTSRAGNPFVRDQVEDRERRPDRTFEGERFIGAYGDVLDVFARGMLHLEPVVSRADARELERRISFQLSIEEHPRVTGIAGDGDPPHGIVQLHDLRGVVPWLVGAEGEPDALVAFEAELDVVLAQRQGHQLERRRQA